MSELKFDRARFDAGEMPTRTRDGRKALWVGNSGLDIEYPIVAIIKVFGSADYTRDGKYCSDGTLNLLDLVHEPKTRTIKIAVCLPRDPVTSGVYAITSDHYDDFERIVERVSKEDRLLHLIEVEVPE